MNHEQDTNIPSPGYRQIYINDSQPVKYCSNSISTTKYTVLTFLPLFLYEQFHNYTNCFFLLVSIIQQFPEASTLGRYTTVIPLGIILTVSAVKEVLEDLRRYKADTLVNTKTIEVYRNLSWFRIQWKDVQVGDLIRAYSDEFFPSDVLFLTGNSHSGDDDVCYIETVNLDGENNYKVRHRVPGAHVKQITDLRAIIKCDMPNEHIYNFRGIFKQRNTNVRIPLTTNHLLLRGSILRNINWIIGVVVYTGRDTKIMKNSSTTRLKRSSVSKMVNSHIIVLFCLFVTLTIVHWMFFLVFNNTLYADHVSYMEISEQRVFEGSTMIIGLVFGVIYSIVIPISLPVMQELSRFIQAIFISDDLDIYDEHTDTPTQVKTSSLNEDLALVKYIFSDKTGTLTKNVLEFKYCSIEGAIYTMKKLKKLPKEETHVRQSTWNFFIAITLCPGVIPVRKNEDIIYYASSPDQKTLVTTAHDFGVVLIRRTHNEVKLKIEETFRTYEVKCDFEFTSERKRTSVIVKSADNEFILFVIGSDDVIIPRVNHDEVVEQTKKHIEEFSAKGMRSICVAMAKIRKIEFEKWYPSYKRAYEAYQAKEKLMGEAEASIVRNLTLLGCTAVEDKLQDEVPETIEALLQAGINFWILTGDKQETATNIGHACHLLSIDMPLIVLNSEDLSKLQYTINHYKRVLGERFGVPGSHYGLIVNGSSLQLLFESPQDTGNFVSLMLSCRAVICCRTTPKQKAQIVRNVQKRTRYVTLAIGDGANDVAMIQTASIGIGISGVEGLQAANAADYSIGQFKYLKKLLLVHGTWCYNRICKMIFFIYYKNVAIALIQFLYVSTNAWSGFLFFDRWAKMLYNVLLTCLPTLALGIFERNLPELTLLQFPYVYARNNWFNFSTFCVCLMNALLHSILLLLLSLTIFKDDVFWYSGLNDQYAVLGNMVYTNLLVVVTLKSVLHTCHWTNVTFFCLVASLTTWPVVLFMLSHTWPFLQIGEDMPYVFEIIVSTPLFWVYLLFVVVTVLSFDLTIIILYKTFRQPLTSLLSTLQHFTHIRRRNS